MQRCSGYHQYLVSKKESDHDPYRYRANVWLHHHWHRRFHY